MMALHAADMVQLGTKIWGAQNHSHSTRTEARFGANGSKSIDLVKATYYDHEAKEGGGFRDLYRLVNGEFPENGYDKKTEFYLPAALIREHGPCVGWWDYHNEHSAAVIRVVRLQHPGSIEKTFRQCRPADGRWIWKTQGIQVPPYRYPLLLKAKPGSTAFIVEGEKKADALIAWGLVATCSPGGSGKFLDHHAEALASFKCIVLPDNDDAGSKHATDVVHKLQAAGCKDIRIVTLPDLPPKGDVINWIALGGTAEKLAQLVNEAPEIAQQESLDSLGIWDAGQDDYKIDPRGWLLGSLFCRKFLSSLIADGGVGKTALRIAQLMSLAIGRSLTGEHVFRRCRVLIVSFEDDRDELRRRVYAAMLKYGIRPGDVKGWLFLAAPKSLKLAKMKDGELQVSELEILLRKTIKTYDIDVVSLDPFVKTHGLEENNNGAIDFVCDLLATIAIDLNCAIDVPHHTNKGLASAGDANKGRGASSMKDALRLVYTLTAMSPEEAQIFGLDEIQRRSLIRMDSGKVNIAPPSSDATWFNLIGIPLGNANEEYPAGDHVQTVERWHPPDTMAGLDSSLLNRILDSIDAGMPDGQRYSGANAAGKRAAWLVVQAAAPDKTEKQCRAVVAVWLKSGTLIPEDYEDPIQRRTRSGLRVAIAKRPS